MPGSDIRTEVITFRGVVQGVGFRPTVYRIAQTLGMKGRVRNMGGIVQVVCTGSSGKIDAFVREIVSRKPPMAKISDVSRKTINTTVFQDFSIGQSSQAEDEIAVVPADIAVCEDCLREFYDCDDPRYRHPFISCTNCGPRFSILERLPYDRDTTTMKDFPMCGFCGGEYRDPACRRYHAQTISCHDCGPQPLPGIEEAAGILSAGGVVAIKGTGGYYLACTPFEEESVQRLRAIKHREQKPFAVMFRDVEQIKEYCVVSPQEEAALSSPERPILLLAQRPDAAGTQRGRFFLCSEKAKDIKRTVPVMSSSLSLAPGVSNTSRFVGAFLPSLGLQYLLVDAAGPLIMTSANLSELPLITEDRVMEQMAERDRRIEEVLTNKRRIVSGLDDSVARVVDGEVQLIRRSKGFVPAPVYVQAADNLTKDAQIFAAGAHLKSALALSKGAYSYMSRHIGDLESVEAEAVYKETYERMRDFFEIKPGLAVCDMHPRYYSTRFAEDLGLPVVRVQHHQAHIASVMAEHGLKEPVIGVSFDGTGYGPDGAVWGGEVLICDNTAYERFSHLKYIDIIGGDDSMKDAWKSALSHVYAAESAVAAEESKSEFVIDLKPYIEYGKEQETLSSGRAKEERDSVTAALRENVNTIKTSSMGRLFDAVCAMLGIHYENRYEGECAIMLENAAQRALQKQRFNDKPSEQENLALCFHTEAARAILSQCRLAREQLNVQKVCLSGGVFQNKVLTEETLRLLRGDCFSVYYNIHVPPNDGGIALGQNYIGMLSLYRK